MNNCIIEKLVSGWAARRALPPPAKYDFYNIVHSIKPFLLLGLISSFRLELVDTLVDGVDWLDSGRRGNGHVHM